MTEEKSFAYLFHWTGVQERSETLSANSRTHIFWLVKVFILITHCLSGGRIFHRGLFSKTVHELVCVKSTDFNEWV